MFPPAIGFIFDSELRKDPEKDELKQRSRKPVHFLPRRMYENYLLHPKAIAAIINADNKEHQSEPLSHKIVQKWIHNARNEVCYLPKNSNQLSESDWLYKVDGATFLENLFLKLSEGRVEFKKPNYSRKITEWLIDNESEYLLGLSNFLVTCLNKNTK